MTQPKYIKFVRENVQTIQLDYARFTLPTITNGVEQVYEDYFTRALAYQEEWKTYKF